MTVCKNNINPLYNNYFRLTFSRGTSQFELMCQRVTLPGLSIGETKQPTTLGTTIPIPTLAANFEPLKKFLWGSINSKDFKSRIFSYMYLFEYHWKLTAPDFNFGTICATIFSI